MIVPQSETGRLQNRIANTLEDAWFAREAFSAVKFGGRTVHVRRVGNGFELTPAGENSVYANQTDAPDAMLQLLLPPLDSGPRPGIDVPIMKLAE